MLRLTEEEAWEALAASHTGILTTLRRDGAPITLPVWFAVDDRSIAFVAPSGTKKVARIRRDPRASFLVESGLRWDELRAVHLTGRVDVVTDPGETARIDELLEVKYRDFRSPKSSMPEETLAHYARQTYLRLAPEARILTWDNARIASNAR